MNATPTSRNYARLCCWFPPAGLSRLAGVAVAGRCRLFLGLVLLVAPAVLRATTYSWNVSAEAGYGTPSNWSPSGPPTSADTAVVGVGSFENATVEFTGSDAYTVNTLTMGSVAGTTAFNMSGGVFTIIKGGTDGFRLGVGSGANATFTQSGGTFSVIRPSTLYQDCVSPGNGAGASGTIVINNGTAVFQCGVEIGYNGVGTVTINGGNVYCSGWWNAGRGSNSGNASTAQGAGTFNLNGGTLWLQQTNISSASRGLYVQQTAACGTVNIRGGTLVCEGIRVMNANSLATGGINPTVTLNVSGGELYLGANGVSKPGTLGGAIVSVNLSGGTFHTTNSLAINSGDADWAWAGNLPATLATSPGPGVVTFAPGLGRTITLNSVLSGAGALVLAGPGTVAMAGANTYSGDTTISQGTLAMIGMGSLASPKIIVASGATLGASAHSPALTLGLGQMLTNSSSTARLKGNISAGPGTVSLLYAPGTPSFLVTGGTLSLAANTVFRVNNTGEALTPGSYKLISAAGGGLVSGAGLPAVTVGGGGVVSGQYTSLGVSGNELYLVVTNDRPPLIGNDVTRGVLPGTTWKMALTDLAALADWSDPDGDPVSLSGVGPFSANGVSVTRDAAYIYYNGALVSDDHFQYTIGDGKLTAMGTVYLREMNVTAVAPSESPYVVSLDGTWRFYLERLTSYYSGSVPNITPVDSSQPFQRLDYVEGAGWTNLAVPGNWEMAGLSPATYYGPDTTSGLYRYWFEVPAAWQGRQVYLSLDGVQDSAQVWVNGQPVLVNEPSWGIDNYHESGWTAFQANLTAQAQFGTSNLLAIRVVKKAPSVDLDTGDYFMLGGIFRPVTLYSVPQTNFAGIQVTTRLLPNNQAAVDVVADVTGGDVSTPVSMTLAGVVTATNAANGKAFFTQVISQPKLWSAEFPNLYDLTLQLKDAAGQISETVSNRIGIRELSITNGVLLLNGVPVKFAGVCNHDASGTQGNAMGPEDWRKDLLMMKAANINAIRTTHYPFGAGFYDLCDELGFYVVDELPYCWCDSATGDPAMLPAFQQRARETIRRDRNHPSVVVWAIGNENKAGANLQSIVDLVQALDPTRPRLVSNFDGPQYGVELSDKHYPTIATMRSDGLSAASTGCPHVYTENPNTWDVRLAADAGMWERWGIAQQRVWEACWQYDTIPGTFPFEWADRAVADPNADSSYSQYQSTGVQLLYSFPATGVHLLKLKGMVDCFRNPRPNVYEAQMAYSPVRIGTLLTVASDQVSFPVTNRYSFTDLGCLTMAWKLQREGLTLASGRANPSLPPRSQGRVQVSVPASALAYADSFRVDFIHPDGRDIMAHQFTLTPPAPASQMNSTLPAGLPIPAFNLITRQTVADTGYWQKVLRYPASLTGVVLTPPDATTLAQLQSLSATVLGGPSGSQVLGQLYAQYADNQFYYYFWMNSSSSSIEVQELGWVFQMPAACDHFSWDRAARWTVYPASAIGRATGTATPDSMNVDLSRMDQPNAFDFNSTKYDCNWASLATAAGDRLRVEFDPQLRFHCRGGIASNGQGCQLFVNQQVSLPNDFPQPVPDLLMTLTTGDVVQGSFSVGSNAVTGTSSNALASVTAISPGFSSAGGGNEFKLTFSGIRNAHFSVWASTNLVDWAWQGAAAEMALGQYQFFDPASTNTPYRFYRISAP